MNTRFKINRQVVLTIGVLLTAIWLPITTLAKDFSKIDDHTQGTNTWAENCAHCQTMHHSHDLEDCHHSHGALTFLSGSGDRMSEENVGFAETDPTNQQSGGAVTVLQASNHLMQKISVGFSETDPAINQYQESMTKLSAPNSLTQQVSVGFSETDPANNLYRSIEKLRSEHLVDCLGANAKGEDFVTPKITSLTRKDIRAVP